MVPYLYDYGMTFAEYVSGFELVTNPVDLLGVYITCVSFTLPFIIATESLEWTHNAFNCTASPIDYEIYLIFNGGSAFNSSSKYIYYTSVEFYSSMYTCQCKMYGIINFHPFDTCIY